jgi:hypothetical protein
MGVKGSLAGAVFGGFLALIDWRHGGYDDADEIFRERAKQS